MPPQIIQLGSPPTQASGISQTFNQAMMFGLDALFRQQAQERSIGHAELMQERALEAHAEESMLQRDFVSTRDSKQFGHAERMQVMSHNQARQRQRDADAAALYRQMLGQKHDSKEKKFYREHMLEELAIQNRYQRSRDQKQFDYRLGLQDDAQYHARRMAKLGHRFDKENLRDEAIQGRKDLVFQSKLAFDGLPESAKRRMQALEADWQTRSNDPTIQADWELNPEKKKAEQAKYEQQMNALRTISTQGVHRSDIAAMEREEMLYKPQVIKHPVTNEPMLDQAFIPLPNDRIAQLDLTPKNVQAYHDAYKTGMGEVMKAYTRQLSGYGGASIGGTGGGTGGGASPGLPGQQAPMDIKKVLKDFRAETRAAYGLPPEEVQEPTRDWSKVTELMSFDPATGANSFETPPDLIRYIGDGHAREYFVARDAIRDYNKAILTRTGASADQRRDHELALRQIKYLSSIYKSNKAENRPFADMGAWNTPGGMLGKARSTYRMGNIQDDPIEHTFFGAIDAVVPDMPLKSILGPETGQNIYDWGLRQGYAAYNNLNLASNWRVINSIVEDIGEGKHSDEKAAEMFDQVDKYYTHRQWVDMLEESPGLRKRYNKYKEKRHKEEVRKNELERQRRASQAKSRTPSNAGNSTGPVYGQRPVP